MKEKYGTIDFKEEKLGENESEILDAQIKRGEEPAKHNEDEVIENSYDSEFEAEFFGGKNPELNAEMDKNLRQG